LAISLLELGVPTLGNMLSNLDVIVDMVLGYNN
jgi:hypothetical protein